MEHRSFPLSSLISGTRILGCWAQQQSPSLSRAPGNSREASILALPGVAGSPISTWVAGTAVQRYLAVPALEGKSVVRTRVSMTQEPPAALLVCHGAARSFFHSHPPIHQCAHRPTGCLVSDGSTHTSVLRQASRQRDAAMSGLPSRRENSVPPAATSTYLVATGTGTPVYLKRVIVAGGLILAWAGQAGITLGLNCQTGGTCGKGENISKERARV